MNHSLRRILAVKPTGPWLAVVDGAWHVESPAGVTDIPWERSRMWLLPLLERPRPEAESEARKVLDPGDPDLAEALRAIVHRGLTAWSDYWILLALDWMNNDEVERFAEQLHKIAHDQRWSQASRHTAKRLLKQRGLWPPEHHRLA
ncbi:hypothetical protein [Actinoallomurus iriomotensis]|uniref:Uncharacterized protein n=1 Tax=Actinoallomurus iriomotensis TaxID=478107 RepID=A0A9W6RF05_9ACTN|nr:hypothetical protein [Actinoallomurus iriomotensis]GLY74651.1 hypothetical protein Airi01_029180 [Actinoallomurus iriomotensis]